MRNFDSGRIQFLHTGEYSILSLQTLCKTIFDDGVWSPIQQKITVIINISVASQENISDLRSACIFVGLTRAYALRISLLWVIRFPQRKRPDLSYWAHRLLRIINGWRTPKTGFRTMQVNTSLANKPRPKQSWNFFRPRFASVWEGLRTTLSTNILS